MKKVSMIKGTLLAAIVVATPLYNLASADEASASPEAAAVSENLESASSMMDRIEISEVGRNAVTGMHYARQALSQGDSETAKDILNGVADLFSDSDAELTVKTASGYYLPIDQGVGLAEGFTPTEEHEQVFSKARALLSSGDFDGVISTFNEAGVDVVAQLAVLPYSSTVDGLKQALADLDAGELDKVGSDLDQILSAVKVESYAPGALPEQGYTASEIAQS